MKTRWLIVMVALLCGLVTGAETHIFTNKEGKDVEAELVGLEGGAAVLRLKNRSIAKVPLSTLSERDQKYVKAWHEENKNKIKSSDLRVTITKHSKRTKSENKSTGGGGNKNNKNNKNKGKIKVAAYETYYACKLDNYSAKTVEGIKASYTVYKRWSSRDQNGSNNGVDEITGESDLGTLVPNGSVEFESTFVDTEDRSEKGGNGPSKSNREEVIGFVVSFHVGDEELLKECEPRNLLKMMEEEKKREEARSRSGNR